MSDWFLETALKENHGSHEDDAQSTPAPSKHGPAHYSVGREREPTIPVQPTLPICSKCGATSIVAKPEMCHKCRHPFPRKDNGRPLEDGLTAYVSGGRIQQ